MKKIIKTIHAILILSTSFMISTHAVAEGVKWEASYSGTYQHVHAIDSNHRGGFVHAISSVISDGEHSILGTVKAYTILKFDLDDQNTVEFVETDSEGNSLLIKAVGRAGTTEGEWYADGIITGGTGKYKRCSGTYQVIGQNKDGIAHWTASGMLYNLDHFSDEEVIKNVIAAETNHFHKKDMDSWSETVVQSDYFAGVYALKDGQVNKSIGFENAKSTLHQYLKEAGDYKIPTVERKNWNIQIRDNVAWATYDQTTGYPDQVDDSIEMRICEKIEGQWKIAYNVVAIKQ